MVYDYVRKNKERKRVRLQLFCLIYTDKAFKAKSKLDAQKYLNILSDKNLIPLC